MGYQFLYTALSSPLDRSKRFTRFALPGRPLSFDTNSASPGSILVMQQLRATTKSLTCSPLSIATYSCIQLNQLGRQLRERKCPIFETVAKGDSNPGWLDCESGVLPLSYRAPHYQCQTSGHTLLGVHSWCDVDGRLTVHGVFWDEIIFLWQSDVPNEECN